MRRLRRCVGCGRLRPLWGFFLLLRNVPTLNPPTGGAGGAYNLRRQCPNRRPTEGERCPAPVGRGKQVFRSPVIFPGLPKIQILRQAQRFGGGLCPSPECSQNPDFRTLTETLYLFDSVGIQASDRGKRGGATGGGGLVGFGCRPPRAAPPVFAAVAEAVGERRAPRWVVGGAAPARTFYFFFSAFLSKSVENSSKSVENPSKSVEKTVFLLFLPKKFEGVRAAPPFFKNPHFIAFFQMSYVPK